MKNRSKLFAIVSILFSVSSLVAEIQSIDFNGGYFYSSLDDAYKNNYMTSGKLLLVADMTGAGLSNIFLEDNSSIEVNSFLNGGSDYFIFGEAAISSSGMSQGTAFAKLEVDLSSPLAGKEYAIVILGQDSIGSIVSSGESYGVFAPSFVTENVDSLSGGGEWKIPTSSERYVSAFVSTFGAVGEGGIPNEYLVMDKVVSVVPEPATCAFLFGAAALAIAAYRRKR